MRSRRPVVWSHAIDSCPSHFHESGFFVEFEAVRTALTEMLRAGKEGQEEGGGGRSLRERKGRVHVQAETGQEGFQEGSDVAVVARDGFGEALVRRGYGLVCGHSLSREGFKWIYVGVPEEHGFES